MARLVMTALLASCWMPWSWSWSSLCQPSPFSRGFPGCWGLAGRSSHLQASPGRASSSEDETVVMQLGTSVQPGHRSSIWDKLGRGQVLRSGVHLNSAVSTRQRWCAFLPRSCVMGRMVSCYLRRSPWSLARLQEMGWGVQLKGFTSFMAA